MSATTSGAVAADYSGGNAPAATATAASASASAVRADIAGTGAPVSLRSLNFSQQTQFQNHTTTHNTGNTSTSSITQTENQTHGTLPLLDLSLALSSSFQHPLASTGQNTTSTDMQARQLASQHGVGYSFGHDRGGSSSRAAVAAAAASGSQSVPHSPTGLIAPSAPHSPLSPPAMAQTYSASTTPSPSSSTPSASYGPVRKRLESDQTGPPAGAKRRVTPPTTAHHNTTTHSQSPAASRQRHASVERARNRELSRERSGASTSNSSSPRNGNFATTLNNGAATTGINAPPIQTGGPSVAPTFGLSSLLHPQSGLVSELGSFAPQQPAYPPQQERLADERIEDWGMLTELGPIPHSQLSSVDPLRAVPGPYLSTQARPFTFHMPMPSQAPPSGSANRVSPPLANSTGMAVANNTTASSEQIEAQRHESSDVTTSSAPNRQQQDTDQQQPTPSATAANASASTAHAHTQARNATASGVSHSTIPSDGLTSPTPAQVVPENQSENHEPMDVDPDWPVPAVAAPARRTRDESGREQAFVYYQTLQPSTLRRPPTPMPSARPPTPDDDTGTPTGTDTGTGPATRDAPVRQTPAVPQSSPLGGGLAPGRPASDRPSMQAAAHSRVLAWRQHVPSPPESPAGPAGPSRALGSLPSTTSLSAWEPPRAGLNHRGDTYPWPEVPWSEPTPFTDQLTQFVREAEGLEPLPTRAQARPAQTSGTNHPQSGSETRRSDLMRFVADMPRRPNASAPDSDANTANAMNSVSPFASRTDAAVSGLRPFRLVAERSPLLMHRDRNQDHRPITVHPSTTAETAGTNSLPPPPWTGLFSNPRAVPFGTEGTGSTNRDRVQEAMDRMMATNALLQRDLALLRRRVIDHASDHRRTEELVGLLNHTSHQVQQIHENLASTMHPTAVPSAANAHHTAVARAASTAPAAEGSQPRRSTDAQSTSRPSAVDGVPAELLAAYERGRRPSSSDLAAGSSDLAAALSRADRHRELAYLLDRSMSTFPPRPLTTPRGAPAAGSARTSTPMPGLDTPTPAIQALFGMSNRTSSGGIHAGPALSPFTRTQTTTAAAATNPTVSVNGTVNPNSLSLGSGEANPTPAFGVATTPAAIQQRNEALAASHGPAPILASLSRSGTESAGEARAPSGNIAAWVEAQAAQVRRRGLAELRALASADAEAVSQRAAAEHREVSLRLETQHAENRAFAARLEAENQEMMARVEAQNRELHAQAEADLGNARSTAERLHLARHRAAVEAERTRHARHLGALSAEGPNVHERAERAERALELTRAAHTARSVAPTLDARVDTPSTSVAPRNAALRAAFAVPANQGASQPRQQFPPQLRVATGGGGHVRILRQGLQALPEDLKITPEMTDRDRANAVRRIVHLVSHMNASNRRSLAIRTLNRVTWANVNEEGMERDECCAVCQDDYTPEDKVAVTACKHMYHESCLETWLNTPAASTCPMCRRDLAALGFLIRMTSEGATVARRLWLEAPTDSPRHAHTHAAA